MPTPAIPPHTRHLPIEVYNLYDTSLSGRSWFMLGEMSIRTDDAGMVTIDHPSLMALTAYGWREVEQRIRSLIRLGLLRRLGPNTYHVLPPR